MQSASLSTEGVGPAGGGAGDARHGVGQRVGGGGVGLGGGQPVHHELGVPDRLAAARVHHLVIQVGLDARLHGLLVSILATAARTRACTATSTRTPASIYTK